MSGTRHGVSTSAITWEQAESSIQFNDTGGVEIEARGVVGVSNSPTSLDDAVQLIPFFLPISDDGPVGNCIRYLGATMTKPGAKFSGDDLIEVSATYQIANPSSEETETEGESTNSDSDRAQRTIVTEEAPLLTHPVAQDFPTTDRKLLASLLAGDIWVNPRYDSAGSGTQLHEFVRDKEDESGIEEVTFSSSDVTVDDVTASPLDYARLIAAGVTVWRRPVIRHTLSKTRNQPATNGEYGKVGETIATKPNLAPTLNGGQWFLNGITDTTENGLMWNTNYEFEYTAQGGALAALYKGGTAEIG